MLLGFVPFAGVVTLSQYPSPVLTLMKDFLFVIPAYLSFLLMRKRKVSQARIPPSILSAMVALVVLVFIQSFNPGVANWLVAAIGAKVWLFYLPLTFLAFEMLNSREDLIRLLRLMVAIAWIPCGIGIVQWICCIIFGYEATMAAFYGEEAARAVTQEFASFDVGGTFFRISSTFTFVTQYFGYTLAMIVPSYALMKLDTSKKWRKFATAIFWLVLLASFMSGSRSAYVFVPILLMLTYWLEGKLIGTVKIGAMLPLVMLAALSISGIDAMMLFDLMFQLMEHYSDEVVKKGLLDAMSIAPLGMGTGMNTGAARYAFDDPLSFEGIENYYAKAVYELGIVGLLIVVALFVLLMGNGYRIHRRIRDTGLRSCSSAILAFIVVMVLNSFKGWQIELDPISVYFWVFSGFLLKLGYLDKLSQASIRKARLIAAKRYQESLAGATQRI